MTWVYQQSSGTMSREGKPLFKGYSGNGDYVNKPQGQAYRNKGPIPQGMWEIVSKFDSKDHGPFCLRLMPADGTVTFGRAGFLIHGDNSRGDQSASQGCIILPRRAREEIWNSKDKSLEVIA